MPDSPTPADFALVSTARFQVRWADMDALGHVNNAVYFTYVEQARIESLEHLMDEWHAGGTGPVLVHASMTYKRPIKHPATALVRVYIGRPGRTSLQSRYEVTVESDEGTLYAEGEATLVWIDLAKEQPCPLPTPLREAVERRLARRQPESEA